MTNLSRPGRPSLLTPDTINAIAKGIRGGMSLPGAARAVGVSVRTIQRWRKDAEREDEEGKQGLASQFVRAVAQAVADTEGALSGKVMDGALQDRTTTTEILDPDSGKVIRRKIVNHGPDLHLALKILARKYPAEWGTGVSRKTGEEAPPVRARAEYYDPSQPSDPAEDQRYIDSHGPGASEDDGEGEVVYRLPIKDKLQGKDLIPEEPWTDSQVLGVFGRNPTQAQLRRAMREDDPPVFDD